MKSDNKCSLIDGVFTPQEAREILLNIFSSKIQFHKTKNFSSKERNGTEDVTTNNRILQLKSSMEKLEFYINKCEQSGESLIVKSDIIIVKSTKTEG